MSYNIDSNKIKYVLNHSSSVYKGDFRIGLRLSYSEIIDNSNSLKEIDVSIGAVRTFGLSDSQMNYLDDLAKKDDIENGVILSNGLENEMNYNNNLDKFIVSRLLSELSREVLAVNEVELGRNEVSTSILKPIAEGLKLNILTVQMGRVLNYLLTDGLDNSNTILTLSDTMNISIEQMTSVLKSLSRLKLVKVILADSSTNYSVTVLDYSYPNLIKLVSPEDSGSDASISESEDTIGVEEQYVVLAYNDNDERVCSYAGTSRDKAVNEAKSNNNASIETWINGSIFTVEKFMREELTVVFSKIDKLEESIKRKQDALNKDKEELQTLKKMVRRNFN